MPLIDSHLLPRARAQARLIFAICALRDQTFQTLRLNRLDERSQRGVEDRGITNRFRQPREDMLFDEFPPLRQWITHYILTLQNQHVENEKIQRRARGAIVLQAVEGWPAVFIKRHDLAIDDGFIREVGQRVLLQMGGAEPRAAHVPCKRYAATPKIVWMN